MAEGFAVNSEQRLPLCAKWVESLFRKHKYVTLEAKTSKPRTPTQNNSIHKYCELLAEALNGAGYTLTVKVIREVEVPYTKENVKDYIWRPVQIALFQIASSKDLTTKQVSEVYEALNLFLIERFCVYVPWPEKVPQHAIDALLEDAEET